MRRDIRRILLRYFEKELQVQCPYFESAKHAIVPQGGYVYQWKMGMVIFYVILCTWSRFDKFTIECAWSDTGEFPVRLSPPSILPLDHEFDRNNVVRSARFRLARLWTTDDFWWDFGPQLSPNERHEKRMEFLNTFSQVVTSIEGLDPSICCAAMDAVSKIQAAWVPLCRKIAESLQPYKSRR